MLLPGTMVQAIRLTFVRRWQIALVPRLPQTSPRLSAGSYPTCYWLQQQEGLMPLSRRYMLRITRDDERSLAVSDLEPAEIRLRQLPACDVAVLNRLTAQAAFKSGLSVIHHPEDVWER